jgi:16S rRNA (guanine527-N7)-methyltransferase
VIVAMDLDEGLREQAAAGSAPLDRTARNKLAAFLRLLGKWNHTYNLTAIREPERMVTHHVLDALSVLPQLPLRSGIRVLDVGSGPGVPGIPLALAHPDWHFVLIDSSQKKTAFLQQAVIELGLANVEVVQERSEDYAPSAPFDVVISRAFADLAEFAASAAQHLAPEGRLYAMKGELPAEEIARLPAEYRVIATPTLTVPGLDAARHLVIMAPA